MASSSPRELNAEHGIVCRLPGECFGHFGWPTVARRDDSPDENLGYPSTVEMANDSLFTVCYQKAAAGEKCPLLWSRWKLPRQSGVAS